MSRRRWAYEYQTLAVRADRVLSVTISPKSGQLLATGDDSNKVNIWRVGRPVNQLCLSGHKYAVTSTMFNDSEEYVFAGSDSGSIKAFDLKSGKAVRSYVGHKTRASCLAMHPYNSLLASGSNDTTIKIWDVRTKAEIVTYRGHEKDVTCVQFSPDGRWLVSGGEDCRVMFWDLTAGKLVNTSGTAHTAPISQALFHPSDCQLACASKDKTISFWDVLTFSHIASTPKSAHKIGTCAFANSGRESVLLCTTDEALRVWQCREGRATLRDQIDVRWGKVTAGFVREKDPVLVACAPKASMVNVWGADLRGVQPWSLSGSATVPHVELVTRGEAPHLDQIGSQVQTKSPAPGGRRKAAERRATHSSKAPSPPSSPILPSTPKLSPHSGRGPRNNGRFGNADSPGRPGGPGGTSSGNHHGSARDDIRGSARQGGGGGGSASHHIGGGGHVGGGSPKKGLPPSETMLNFLRPDPDSYITADAIGEDELLSALNSAARPTKTTDPLAPQPGTKVVRAPSPPPPPIASRQQETASRSSRGTGSRTGPSSERREQRSAHRDESPNERRRTPTAGRRAVSDTEAPPEPTLQRKASRRDARAAAAASAGASRDNDDSHGTGAKPKADGWGHKRLVGLIARQHARDLVPVLREAPVGLVVADFLPGDNPFGRDKALKLHTADEVLAAVTDDAASFRKAMSARLEATYDLTSLWTAGDRKGVYGALTRSGDATLVIDFLRTVQLQTASLALEDASTLLPLLCKILRSRREEHCLVALETVAALHELFSRIIVITRSSAARGGVSIAHEERLARCNRAYAAFTDARDVVDALCKRRGPLKRAARRLANAWKSFFGT